MLLAGLKSSDGITSWDETSRVCLSFVFLGFKEKQTFALWMFLIDRSETWLDSVTPVPGCAVLKRGPHHKNAGIEIEIHPNKISRTRFKTWIRLINNDGSELCCCSLRTKYLLRTFDSPVLYWEARQSIINQYNQYKRKGFSSPIRITEQITVLPNQ